MVRSAAPHRTSLLTGRAARKRLRPLCAAGRHPVVPVSSERPSRREDDNGTSRAPRRRRASAHARPRRLGSDRHAARARARRREVTLWKDVPGLLTADPRLVPDARVIPQLHLREAAELAYYGAKVLHPRALIPLAARAIPLLRAPVRGSRRRRAPRSPRAARSTLSGEGALGRRRAGAAHRGGQRHAGRARHRRAHVRGAARAGHLGLAHLPGVVGAVDLLHACPRRRPRRARSG